MAVQLTTITTSIGIFSMLTAWLLVGRRIRQSHVDVLRPVKLLNNFFLCMGIFFLFMSVPGIWLAIDPSKFPAYMAWGYVVGHIFLYLGFINVARMIFSITPKLAAKEWLVPIVGWVVLAAVTIFNAVTMIWGTQPAYDYKNYVTLFNANPLVGAAIALMGLGIFLPAGILFLRNAFRSEGSRRTRSLLLGLGFCTFVVAGPPHDVAGNWQTYMVGDVFAILGVLLTGIGVVYKLEQSLSLEKQPAPASPVSAPSNTI